MSASPTESAGTAFFATSEQQREEQQRNMDWESGSAGSSAGGNLTASQLSMYGEGSTSASSSSGDEADEERAYIPGCFEGPEKNLEVCFKPGVGNPLGCRQLTRSQLDLLCKQARCTILNKISNQHQDAYVLSESSLFVWPYKMILKTCGTTTLLRCLPRLLEATQALGMELEWVGYSRKNYFFPTDQYFPHSSFEQELSFLKSHSRLSAKLNGSGYVLGSITADHWFVYVADQCSRPSYECHDRVMNIMMFDMDRDAAEMFYKKDGITAREMTRKSGIADLVPGAQIDDFSFEPCGYSMNAIAYGHYATIHVTPEPECSYASFETSTPLKSYDSLVNNVLRVFKPKRFVLTMMADDQALKEMESGGGKLPFSYSNIAVPGLGKYARSQSSSTTFEKDYRAFMGTWTREEGADMGPIADAEATASTGRRQRSRGISFS